jgi:Zn-dependent membrane protease YugP
MMLSYILFLGIPFIIALIAQGRVMSAFGKYSRVPVSSGMTGADAARRILAAARITNVDVVEADGFLGDHYDPAHKRLCLSSHVYRQPSVAAVGVAAHEAGHAIQHARGYAPLQWRMAIVPITQFSSQLLPFIILGGLFFSNLRGLLWLGIIAYAVITVFQLVTLPVEFDASRRAKIILGEMGIVQRGGEAAGVSNVLGAAALTYVAAFVGALGNLLHLALLMLGGSNRE